MSTIRAAKAYQAQPKSNISSADMHSTSAVEGSHDAYGLHNSLEHAANAHEFEKNSALHRDIEDQSHHDVASDSKTSIAHQKQNASVASHDRSYVSIHSKKGDVQKFKVTDDNDNGDDNKNTAPTQGVGMGINSGVPVTKNNEAENLSDLFSAKKSSLDSFVSTDTTGTGELDDSDSKKEVPFPTQGVGVGFNSGIPVVTSQSKGGISDLLSAAVSSLSSLTSTDGTTSALGEFEDDKSNVSEESSGFLAASLVSQTASDFKSEESVSEESPGFSAASLVSQTASDFKSEGSIGSAGALGGTVSKQMASAIRTGNLSDFLSELTATVSQVRRNSANGQDITLQLRSDVLDATSIHINANTAQMQVAFSTTSAASNALLNAHLTTLQNHLAMLCPGQAVEVKNQFLASSSSSNFNNDGETRDDLASFNQENRGNLSKRDETL
ncbi:MAG: type III secretion HpaP family protein [Chthoniobacterales bacterium]